MAIIVCMSEKTDNIEYGHVSINGDWFHLNMCPWGYRISNGSLKLQWAYNGSVCLDESYDNIGADTIIFVTFTLIGSRVSGTPSIEVRRSVDDEQIKKVSVLVDSVKVLLDDNYRKALNGLDETVSRMRGSFPDSKLDMIAEAGRRRMALVDRRSEDALAIFEQFIQSDNLMRILEGRYYASSTAKPYLSSKAPTKSSGSFSDSTKSSGSKSSSSGCCYVATCVYGSYDCPEVWTLRRYRDEKLGKTWYGRLFIRTYYAISPTIVKWFGKTKWFQRMFRKRLDKMVARLQSEGFDNTPYEDKTW